MRISQLLCCSLILSRKHRFKMDIKLVWKDLKFVCLDCSSFLIVTGSKEADRVVYVASALLCRFICFV